MGEATANKKRVLASILVAICANFYAFGCSGMSLQSIDQKNQQLPAAQRELLQNPKNQKALSVIIEMLKDRNGIARSNAAATLGGLAEKIAPDIKDAAVPSLITLLENGDDFDRKAAACALKEFRTFAKDAIPILKRNLVPSDRETAWCSAEALGAMGDLAQEAVPDLLKAIRNDERNFSVDRSSISEFAAKALGGIGPAAKEAVPDLENLLNHQNAYFRIFVSVALIEIDPSNQKAFAALNKLFEDSDVEVRRKTIWSLKDIGIKAKPAKSLIQRAYLKDKDSSVQSAASDLLLTLDKQ